MTTYAFRCPAHGEVVLRFPMGEAGDTRPCPHCGATARRVWSVSRQIIRPRGYNLRPGEYAGPGLGYSFFDYELERGELRDDATGAYTPESRAKREAEIAATDVYVPRPMEEIDRDIPHKAHQELHEWARAVHSQLTEEEA